MFLTLLSVQNLNINELTVDDVPKVSPSEVKTTDSNRNELSANDNSITNPQTSTAKKVNDLSAYRQQWKHTNYELVNSSCKYTAQYLGSTLVRELHGINSTRASIEKMKKSCNDIAKVPHVVLAISYNGVQFIDAQTNVSRDY